MSVIKEDGMLDGDCELKLAHLFENKDDLTKEEVEVLEKYNHCHGPGGKFCSTGGSTGGGGGGGLSMETEGSRPLPGTGGGGGGPYIVTSSGIIDTDAEVPREMPNIPKNQPPAKPYQDRSTLNRGEKLNLVRAGVKDHPDARKDLNPYLGEKVQINALVTDHRVAKKTGQPTVMLASMAVKTSDGRVHYIDHAWMDDPSPALRSVKPGTTVSLEANVRRYSKPVFKKRPGKEDEYIRSGADYGIQNPQNLRTLQPRKRVTNDPDFVAPKAGRQIVEQKPNPVVINTGRGKITIDPNANKPTTTSQEPGLGWKTPKPKPTTPATPPTTKPKVDTTTKPAANQDFLDAKRKIEELKRRNAIKGIDVGDVHVAGPSWKGKKRSEMTKEELAACEKARATCPKVKKTVEIAKVDTDQRLIYGVVLVPDVEDLQGDICSKEDIQEAAHDYLVNSRLIKAQHRAPTDADVVECYIAPVDIPLGKGIVPAGSWVMVTKVNSNAMWTAIKKGDITGYSIGGRGTREEI